MTSDQQHSQLRQEAGDPIHQHSKCRISFVVVFFCTLMGEVFMLLTTHALVVVDVVCCMEVQVCQFTLVLGVVHIVSSLSATQQSTHCGMCISEQH